ncbi:MAG: OadG family protein [Oscillospiraceae bacterium]|nr:OadG family protein [Oscillospiraceae bacterium]
MYSESLLTGQNLSLGEALATGGQTTVIGLAIVFSVLVVLMIVLYLFKVIFYKDPNKKKMADTKQEPAPTIETAPAVTEETDEEELIAVLTAAVAASLNTSTYNLRIKSYRRTDNKMPAWNRAGVTETINNRF